MRMMNVLLLLFWWWWWWWYVYRDTNQSVGINKKEKKGKHEVSVEALLDVGRDAS